MGDGLRHLTRKEYPHGLGEIPDPPKALWVRGSLPTEEKKRLAVVGSRSLSPYGKDALTYLIKGLAGYPISIVSGLSVGTDSVAHEAALDAGLRTVAVLTSGLSDEAIAPRSNRSLAERIMSSGGALVSEYAPETEEAPDAFLARNRLVVGLAHAVLVVEAAERSGTLVAARLAAEYNRDLLCIPHRINDLHGVSAHVFIRLGAALIARPEHILEALAIPENRLPEITLTLSGPEKAIYDLLIDPMPKNILLRKSRLSQHETIEVLASLHLKGLLKEEMGAWQRT